MRAAIYLTLLACLAAAVFTLRLRDEMVDFEVYRTAGERAAAGEPLYREADGHFQFKYFAPFALMLAPFATLPVTAAKGVWFALSVAFLVALIALSMRRLPNRVVAAPLITIATIVTLGKFYAHELELGQTNLLFGVVVMAALAQLQNTRETAAGMAFGAATVVKPYGLVFLPYLLATRRFGAAAACVAVLLLAMAAPAMIYGFAGNLELLGAWWNTVTGTNAESLVNQDNISIGAMYVKWLGAGSATEWLTVVTGLLLVGLCAAVIVMRRRSTRPEYLEVALLLIATVLLSPQGWDYVLLLSTPAIMLLIDALPRFSRPLQMTTVTCLGVIGLSIYDVMGRAAYSRFMSLSAITVVYGVLIGIIVYVRARRMR
jgi:hypothetical protein